MKKDEFLHELKQIASIKTVLKVWSEKILEKNAMLHDREFRLFDKIVKEGIDKED